MKKRLDEKHILVGVCGSIAAYKSCEVVRRLQHEGAEVRVVMTSAAQKFITPLTYETFTNEEVVTELFPQHHVVRTHHIHLAEWADCILVCPATANVIGKVASGIADDMLTTLITASRCPVIFAPAMDYQMIRNPIYLDNCRKLESFGYRLIETETGELASGACGPGRLPEAPMIIGNVKQALLCGNELKGKRLLVTAGPTRESIDPVRYITNHSTGRMGFALAEEALYMGADVTLISGPTNLHPLQGIRLIKVTTAMEMETAVLDAWKDHDVLIMAAAVADYRMKTTHQQKIKKTESTLQLSLDRTEDILKSAADVKGERIVVGFALETADGLKNARKKLKEKNVDLICLNNLLDEGAAFAGETNKVQLINSFGEERSLSLMMKWEVSIEILKHIKSMMMKRNNHGK